MFILPAFILLLWLIYKFVFYALAAGSYILFRHKGAGDGRVLDRTDSREVNNIITDGLAAHSPGSSYIFAAALALALPLLALPPVHYIYVKLTNIASLTDSFMATSSMRTDSYAKALTQITSYLPRVGFNLIALALIGLFFAIRRRRLLRRSPYRKLLLWQVSSTECFATVLGWFLYYLFAVFPRTTATGYINYAGMLTLSGGWLWVTCGPLFSWYLHAAQNAILWSMFTYRWTDAIPGVVKMMAMHRLQLPPHGISEVITDYATGTVKIKAHIDALNVARLRDDLLAVPGLRNPVIEPLGALPGSPVNIVNLPPRMKPLPPKAFRRPQGPPPGYNAENNLVETDEP